MTNEEQRHRTEAHIHTGDTRHEATDPRDATERDRIEAEERGGIAEDRAKVAVQTSELVGFRLDRFDRSLEKMSATVEKYAEISVQAANDTAATKEAVKELSKTVKEFVQVAISAASETSSLTKILRVLGPIVLAIVVAGSYVSATSKSDTVCAAVNRNRADMQSFISAFQPVARPQARPVLEQQVAIFSRPAC